MADPPPHDRVHELHEVQLLTRQCVTGQRLLRRLRQAFKGVKTAAMTPSARIRAANRIISKKANASSNVLYTSVHVLHAQCIPGTAARDLTSSTRFHDGWMDGFYDIECLHATVIGERASPDISHCGEELTVLRARDRSS